MTTADSPETITRKTFSSATENLFSGFLLSKSDLLLVFLFYPSKPLSSHTSGFL